MDVLCTDKTGTLTIDHVILEIHCDVFKNESAEVLRDAYLISHFQTGLKNVLDRAVLKYSELHRELSVDKYSKVDEIPFDFSRRMMSVVVEGPDGQRQLLTKGAPESVFKKCTHFESDGEIFPMEPILVGNLIEQVNSLSEDGFRVLAIANKKVGAQSRLFQGGRGKTGVDGLSGVSRSAQGHGQDRHCRAAPARRDGEGFDRRQRSGHAQSLHRGRHQRRKNPARQRRGKNDGRATGRGD